MKFGTGDTIEICNGNSQLLTLILKKNEMLILISWYIEVNIIIIEKEKMKISYINCNY